MFTRRSAEGQVDGAGRRITGTGVTGDQAIAVWALGNAYDSFEEQIKGSFGPEKLADLVMLSDDPRLLDSNQIGNIRVDMTVIGSRVIYHRDQGQR